MARDEYILSDESGPCLFEVGKRDRFVNFGGTKVATDDELKAVIRLEVQKTFVEGTVMIESDFGVLL